MFLSLPQSRRGNRSNQKRLTLEVMEKRELFAGDLIRSALAGSVIQAVEHSKTSAISQLEVEDADLSWDASCEYSVSNDGVVSIQGGMSSDQVTITDNAVTGTTLIDIQCGSGEHIPWMFPSGEVQEIIFHGGWGHDSFTNLSLIPSVAYGDGGNDKLVGGGSRDELHGGIGNDDLQGNGMSWGMLVGDKLYGDQGDDKLKGGGWNDLLSGGSGHDEIFGNGGSDLLIGGFGNDVLRGGSGNDQLNGGAGWDQLFGDQGDDILEGGNDGIADELTGGAGNDTFVNEWRKKTSRGWIPVEFESINDFQSGDSLEWKQTPSRLRLAWTVPFDL